MKAGNNHAIGAFAAAIALAATAAVASPVATSAPAPGTYALKDGTTLFVAENGRMRMFTAEGQRLHMNDGVAMETRDGRKFTMKEDLNWKRIRQSGTRNPKFN